MPTDNQVLRTIGSWQQFFAGDKRQLMLLQMLIVEKGWSSNLRMSYEDLTSAMTLIGNRCLHDTDNCLHNTRRGL